ncbi:MAG: cysteine--tRNA ligase [Acholeplasmataceae bacterium]|nr:cysteine--tRNA ligase [Acholeplasmataceae bacterium]
MLKLYNTYTKKIETFKPIEDNKVSMYVCGPTVYGDIHIGNARPVIFFDVLKKYFEFRGYTVRYVSNITDVDDRIIERAKTLQVDENILTETYTQAFMKMVTALGSVLPDEMPKATDYIKHMIVYIDQLIEHGYAYARPNGVYFRVHKVGAYGTLSKQNLDELDEGVRIQLEEEKEDPRDFSIWKVSEEGLHFDSPWGKGRPGWHTECAVMNHEIFGGMIDIHGGGTDLKFPHHENEIAQTIAHDHHRLAKVWMHVGRVDINQVKMSKSLNNFVLAKDLIMRVDPHAFRLLIIGHHYRQPIQYHDELMMQFSKEYDKILRALKKAYMCLTLNQTHDKKIDHTLIDRFIGHMDDDLNIPNVMTLVYEVIKTMNKETNLHHLAVTYNTLEQILEVLGMMPAYQLDGDTLHLYRQWEQARKEKNFQQADLLRSKLIDQGWM